MKLLKTNYDYELKINTQTKQLDDIKNYFEKYILEIIKIYSIDFSIQIFKFRGLIIFKYKEAKKEILDNKKNNDILKMELNKELQDKNLEYALEKDQKEELILKMDELNGTIKELKEECDNNKRIEIENNALILKMKIVLNEKNEHLMMMNEELEHYIREYEKEKTNHQNSLNSLRALENRIYIQEKQKEREKN